VSPRLLAQENAFADLQQTYVGEGGGTARSAAVRNLLKNRQCMKGRKGGDARSDKKVINASDPLTRFSGLEPISGLRERVFADSPRFNLRRFPSGSLDDALTRLSDNLRKSSP